MGRGHRRAVPSGVAAARHARYDSNAGRAHANLRPPSAEIRSIDARERDQLRQRPLRVASILWIFAEFSDRRHAQHAGHITRKLHGPAGVTRTDYAGYSIQASFRDFLRHDFGELLGADADLHNVQASFDALTQSINEIAEVPARYHFEYVQFGVRRA